MLCTILENRNVNYRLVRGTLLVEAKEASTSESLHWDTGSKSIHCAFKLTRYIIEVRAAP